MTSRLFNATRACVTSFAMIAGASQIASAQDARNIGEVVTVFKWVGANHKISITAFEDPKVAGVTCHISRPVAGGITGSLGIAEEKSDASVTCRQTGPISYREPIVAGTKGEEVFNEKRNMFFKALHVTRFFDEASQTLVYLTWSDKLIDGSPKSSLSAVTPMPWPTETGMVKAEKPRLAR